MDRERATIGAVRIAWIDTSTPPPIPHGFVRTLSLEQRRRYETAVPEQAIRFLAGRWLMTSLIDDISGASSAPADICSLCPRCGRMDHGPARTTAPVAISVSYARDIVAVACVSSSLVAPGHHTSLGIDIEALPSGGGSAPRYELGALFAPCRPPNTRDWTMIEAALKADGRGLRVGPERVHFAQCTRSELLPDSHAVHIDGADSGIVVAAGPAPTGFVVSVALRPAATAGR